MLAWDRAVDSAIVAQVDVETRVFSRLAALNAENFRDPTWLDDGNLIFDMEETGGAQALYSLRPGDSLKRLGPLPHASAVYSISADGRHLVAVTQSDKMDVYMIRNFGEFLK